MHFAFHVTINSITSYAFQECAVIKRIINSLVAAFVLLVPCLAFALPGAHDPLSGRGYTCNSCHTSGSSVGNKETGASNYSTNVCFRCHSNSGPVPVKSSNKFGTEDWANPFGTGTLPRGSALQSSHKWFGSDTVPAAGAVAPVDTIANGLNKNVNFLGTIFCARCHNVHGTSGGQSLSSPYLRYPNDQDQLCLNCHRPRDTKDHTLGTHPVNISYTSATAKVKVAKGELRATPLVNAMNPTGQVKLKNGKVVCTTCHGVHNTDSRSSTFDPFSSNQTFGQLSSSKGYLLRVDARGKTANDVNICTNCHAGKVAHNGNNQNIQCNDCHGGHVEYDATAPTEMKNVYLVRRFNTYSASTGGFNKKRVLFRYTGASNREYYNYPAKTGVCQGCHNPTPDHFSGGVEANGLVRITCSECHKHNDTAGSFKAAGCDICHGYPPRANVLGTSEPGSVKTGYAPGYSAFSGYYDESKTPHASHAAGGGTNYQFPCMQCHNGNNHQNGVFTDVFISKAGILAGPSAGYARPNCSNVYCHSDGAGTYKAVAWGTGKGSIIGQPNECTSCHDNSTTDFRGQHFRHVAGKGYDCVTCHSETVSDNKTLLPASRLSGGKHVNAVKDVKFSGVTPAVGASCANVYCHSDGKGVYPAVSPDWANAATGACGTCHRTATPVSGSIQDSGKHFTHISSSYGPKRNNNTLCNNCHVFTGELASTHVDGTISKKSGSNWCQNCHGGAVPTNWAGPGGVSCQMCHSGHGNGTTDTPNSRSWSNFDGTGVQAPFKSWTTFVNIGHGSKSSIQCKDCHDNKSSHISGVLGDTRRLPDGKDTNSNWGASGNNNLCYTCHTAGQSAANKIRPTHYSSKGETTPTMRCAQCHDVHGTNNPRMIRRLISFHVDSSAHNLNFVSGSFVQTSEPYRGLCQICHTLTNHFRRGQSNFNIGGGSTSHASFDSSTNCLMCHKHGEGESAVGNIAFKPGGACNACHGYPPVPVLGAMAQQNNYSTARLQNYSGGGGVHAVAGHLPATVKASNGWNEDCSKCHYNTVHTMDTSLWNAANSTATRKTNVSVTVDPQYKFNATATLDSSRYVKETSASTGTCSNVRCHFQPSPRWAPDK